MLQNTKMKLLQSKKINAFGGLNFVHHHLSTLEVSALLESQLPCLADNSTYSWSDIFSTLLSIYFCGGDCIEDAKTILKAHVGKNPFFKLCSPDTLLRRLKSLQSPEQTCETTRGKVTHEYNTNDTLAKLNVALLNSLGCFDKEELVIDYDNTIIFTEKQDANMTYKKAHGYQPGVFLLDEKNVLYLENRNGNSDAKAFQSKTLERMFAILESQSIVGKSIVFRADAASHQYEVFKKLKDNHCKFYIGAVTAYVEKLFSTVQHWKKVTDADEDKWIGETTYQPFKKYYTSEEEVPTYRLLVKRSIKQSRQISTTTGDAYAYRAIITNDFTTELGEAVDFYNQRGAAEKQFDVLKNDFGWSRVPFSKLSENCVFMYFSAMCRNLYNSIIETFAKQYKNVRSTDRMKRFVFAFVTIPAVWVTKARQWHLRIYGDVELQI